MILRNVLSQFFIVKYILILSRLRDGWGDPPTRVARSERPINVEMLLRSEMIIYFQGDDSGKRGDTMAGNGSGVRRLRHGLDAWMGGRNSWISHR